MHTYTVNLDPLAAKLYRRIAEALGQPVEQILADALFQLAGELSLEALGYPTREPPTTHS